MSRELILVPKEKFEKMLEKIEREEDKLKRVEMPAAKNRSSSDEQLSDDNNWEEQSEVLEATQVEKPTVETKPEVAPAEKISPKLEQSQNAKPPKGKRDSNETQWGVKRKLNDFMKPTKGRKWVRLR